MKRVPNRKPIKYKDRYYNSITELAEELRISIQSISKSLRLGQKVKGSEIQEL